MVFGNLDERSGTGVAFTRDPASGAQGIYGDYLQNAQGEDVVAGIRNAVALKELGQLDPKSYAELLDIMATLMIPQQSGRIINISSVEGKHGKPVLTAYVAAKHGINGLTKAVAKEVGTQGITVNSICPGLVITDIIKNNGPSTAEAMGMSFDDMVQLFASESAIKRPNTVEEVAAVALLLASDNAAGITGAIYSVDGGTAAY